MEGVVVMRVHGLRVTPITPFEYTRQLLLSGWCDIAEARKLIAEKRKNGK